MPDWAVLRRQLLVDIPDSVPPPTIELPILPRALTEFMRQSEDPDVDFQQLGRIIATDTGLSSELLRHANSCNVAAAKQITSVQQALSMLGVRSAQLYLTTSGLKQAMRSKSSKLIHFQSFWNTNLERALVAREIATLLGVDADLAFTAGMLQDFLLPSITNQLYSTYLEFMERRDQYSDLVSFEREKFGWDHAQAAAQIMLSWHLPDELICCICLHHRGKELFADDQWNKTSAVAAAVAALLPDPLCQDAHGLSTLFELEQTWGVFQVMPLAERVDEAFHEMAGSTRNHFSFLKNCQKYLERLERQGSEIPAPTSHS